MSTIVVNQIDPFFIGGNITFNGTEIRNNPNETIIGIGRFSLQNATGNNNTAIGRAALTTVTTGDDNVAVGNGGLQLCTGNNNTAIGRNAGYTTTTGTNNIFLGHISVGSTVTSSNEITLGNSANTVLRCQATSITSLSDGRDKKEIQPLEVGLSFINQLKPVTFVWDDRDENGKRDIKDFGFIAQDLKKAQEETNISDTLKLVYESNPDKLEASYGKLVPILVKSIQDLSSEIEELKKLISLK